MQSKRSAEQMAPVNDIFGNVTRPFLRFVRICGSLGLRSTGLRILDPAAILLGPGMCLSIPTCV